MTEDHAAVIALRALAWLAEAELLDAFQTTTGADRETIRNAAQDPDFLAAILDFVLSDDAFVLRASDRLDLQPTVLAEARAALPGGALPNWT